MINLATPGCRFCGDGAVCCRAGPHGFSNSQSAKTQLSSCHPRCPANVADTSTLWHRAVLRKVGPTRGVQRARSSWRVKLRNAPTTTTLGGQGLRGSAPTTRHVRSTALPTDPAPKQHGPTMCLRASHPAFAEASLGTSPHDSFPRHPRSLQRHEDELMNKKHKNKQVHPLELEPTWLEPKSTSPARDGWHGSTATSRWMSSRPRPSCNSSTQFGMKCSLLQWHSEKGTPMSVA